MTEVSQALEEKKKKKDKNLWTEQMGLSNSTRKDGQGSKRGPEIQKNF